MEVGLGSLREVKVNDDVDGLNVDTPSQQICSSEQHSHMHTCTAHDNILYMYMYAYPTPLATCTCNTCMYMYIFMNINMLVELYIAYHSIDFIDILDVSVSWTFNDKGPRDRNVQDIDEIYAMISYI